MTPRKQSRKPQANKFEGDFLHLAIYLVAFLKRDAAEMDRQVAWASGKPGTEDLLLSFQSDTKAYYGQLAKARDFSRRAVDAAVRSDSKETAGLWQVSAALREAEFGNPATAKQGVAAALALSPGRDVKCFRPWRLPGRGEAVRAQVYWRRTGKELRVANPDEGLLAAHHQGSDRTEHQQSGARPWCFWKPQHPMNWDEPPQFQLGTMYPAYVRGQAQLMAHNGAAAATEFRKFLDHPGIVLNFPLALLPISASPVPTPSPATPPKPAPPIRTSSLSGKTPTPTSPS